MGFRFFSFVVILVSSNFSLASEFKDIPLRVDKIVCTYHVGEDPWQSRIHIMGKLNGKSVSEDAIISFADCGQILVKLGPIGVQHFIAHFDLSEQSLSEFPAVSGNQLVIDGVRDNQFMFTHKIP